MTISTGDIPASNRATCSGFVLSPHRRRCLPRIHRSPGIVTGFFGTSGTSSGSVSPWAISALANRMSISSFPETREVQVEIKAFEILQFHYEQSFIPPGIQCEFVVGNDVGPFLSFGKVGKPNTRGFGDAKPIARQDAAVAGYNSTVAVNQNRIGPAEFAHAGDYLIDLFFRMSAGVSGIRDEGFDWEIFNSEPFPHFGIPFNPETVQPVEKSLASSVSSVMRDRLIDDLVAVWTNSHGAQLGRGSILSTQWLKN